MEMLIVTAIIAVLVAVAIPVFSASLEKARAATCSANRRSLQSVVVTAALSGESDSCQTAFAALYDAKRYVCPDGGTYTWVDSGETGYVKCSVHGTGESGTGGSGAGTSYYPGTSIALQANSWPTDADYAASSQPTITVRPGGVFQYTDGKYYVVFAAVALEKDQAATGPGGTAFHWWATVPFTGNSVSYTASDPTDHKSPARGDYCQYQGGYYVFIDNGGWVLSPGQEPARWYKLPA